MHTDKHRAQKRIDPHLFQYASDDLNASENDEQNRSIHEELDNFGQSPVDALSRVGHARSVFDWRENVIDRFLQYSVKFSQVSLAEVIEVLF
jgi:hypothetical protein